MCIEESEEYLEPTFEIANNPMWSTIDGHFIGNYAEQKDGSVRHFSELSFVIWFEKSQDKDYSLLSHKEGIMLCFDLDGVRHWIPQHLVRESYGQTDWLELTEERESQNMWGRMITNFITYDRRTQNEQSFD